MSKKYTFEFVQNYFIEKNCIPKFTEYKNSHIKLDYVCSNGHKHTITWNSFKQGTRCSYCAGNSLLEFEDIKNNFEGYGYILLSTKYKNSNTKLDYTCPNGHRHSITWNNWRLGQRCPKCAANTIPEFDNIKQDFTDNNCILKSTKYINNHTKLEYICSNGHEHSITWADWQRGKRCSYCAGNARNTTEFVKNCFIKNNYIPKFEKYINNKTKLNYICPEGHRDSVAWGSWQKGIRCPSCAGNKKLTHEFVNFKFEEKNCTLLSDEYINSSTKLEYICPNGHGHSITWEAWLRGNKCPKCTDYGTSKFEKEIKDFVLSLNQKIIENDRTTIMGNKGKHLELDILLPCKTKAIECNGIYWHQNRKHVDKIKQKQCKELGINLLTITDEMWYNSRKKCEDKIKKFLVD